MIDHAFVDRAEELGLKDFCRAVADGLCGKDGFMRGGSTCSCGHGPMTRVTRDRQSLLLEPHDRTCSRIRWALLFASPETIAHMVAADHMTALLAQALDLQPSGELYDDVKLARTLLGK